MSEITSWIAIGLASISLLWNIILYFKDKPKVIPKYHTALIDFSGIGKDIQNVFSINFSNPTKHRVVISSAGILFKNGQNLTFLGRDDGFPKTLLQGDSGMVFRDIDVIQKNIEEQGEPKYVWVRDATGKIYKGSVNNMVGNVNAMYEDKHKKIK